MDEKQLPSSNDYKASRSIKRSTTCVLRNKMLPSIEEAFVLIFQTDTTAHALAIGSHPIFTTHPINSINRKKKL
jgi:hypothetical protein